MPRRSSLVASEDAFVFQERLAFLFQPGQANQHSKLIRDMRKYARKRGMTFEAIESDQLPLEITATPALVYQNERGRTIYPGKHMDAEAMKLFVDGNRIALRSVELDFRRSIAYASTGRANTVLVLKLTPWSGAIDASIPDSATWNQSVLEAIADETIFDQYGDVQLTPTDRRYYLDVHAHRSEEGNLFLTYAVFSQFNCHVPIFTNFGEPIGDLESLMQDFDARIRAYVAAPDLGFSPKPVGSKEADSWSELGWPDNFDTDGEQANSTDLSSRPGRAWVAAAGKLSPRASVPDLPMVQFNFPPPIDRYAGTIETLNGNIEWAPDGRSFDGTFEVDVRQLSMGNDALDEYVIKDALKAKKYRTATFQFSNVALPADWKTGQTYELDIPAKMELLGIEIPMPTQATLKATYDEAGNPTMEVSTLMELNIDQPFELIGPDGPDDIKNLVRIRTQFQLSR